MTSTATPESFNLEEPRMQTPDIRILLSHFLRQIEAAHVRTQTQKPKPLHYDFETGGLTVFFWPSEPNPDSKSELDRIKRVAPSELERHRCTHNFRAPCCLCAFIDGSDYTEAQIAIVEVLTRDEDRNRCLLNGEIVAQCAKQRCGYILCLERFYLLSDLPVQRYATRATPLPVQDLVYISDVEKSFRRGEGLFQVMPDVVLRGNRQGLDKVDPIQMKDIRARLWADLMQGMAEDCFWATFVQCMQCNKVAFREHYAVNHQCSTGSGRKGHARANERHHPYNHGAASRPRILARTETLLVDQPELQTMRPRILARTETLLGDQPELQTMRSMPTRPRASTPESAYNYDPDDVSISSSDGFETAREDEDDFGSDGQVEPGSGGSSVVLWWQHEIPDLSSDDTLPDVLTILRQSSSA